ncbi:phage tail tape measure protein [Selenomonas ruminantium]|uniref:Phage tail tape measure protein, TP901 family, core region n=1 Tax=Selenomonas ruminantium TaxID=971 RepID=A0A1H0N1P1_SELRU|nr:phage tail tape measure protein [Selenomonas ruminantium]SDO86649.1 phage tail tape measure protein, TP901 family, core region [Selenomonas ruminantium]
MASEKEFYRLNLVLDMQDKLTSRLSRVDGKVKQVENSFKRTERAVGSLGNARAEPRVTAMVEEAEQNLNRVERAIRKIDSLFARAKIGAEDKTQGKTQQVQSRLRSLTNKAWTVTLALKDNVSGKLSSIKNGLSSPMAAMGLGAATMGAGGFLIDSAQKAMDFSYQISNIQALTNKTQEELAGVKQKALDLGAATQFSSTEAAQGMTELLKAGMTIEQVMNGAADAALNLAAAGELSLPEAAEIMSTAMNSFGLENAAHAADILAGAANASATDVHEMKYALASVASVASAVGMSFDDTNTALAVFASKGLKGSDAGTSLKTMLMRLQPETKAQYQAFEKLGLLTEQGTSKFYDAEGRMKSLAEIADLLSTSMSGLTQMEQQSLLSTMFGTDAIRGGAILTKLGGKGVRDMAGAMTEYTAAEVAQKKWDNAKGDLVRLQSAFQNFQVQALAPLEPAISKVAKGLSDFFSGNVEGAAGSMENLSNRIVGFMESLENDEQFQAMDWGDKIVYVLDKMIAAVDEWVSGSGGQQFGKVLEKLAEIGMRAFMAALFGLFKGAMKNLFEGNFIGAAGLGLGFTMLGGGKVLGGLARGARAVGQFALGGERAGAVFNDARALAQESGRGRIMSMVDAARFTVETSPIGRAVAGIAESPAARAVGKFVGKAAAPIAAVTDAYDLATSDNKGEKAGAIAGHWAGAALGAKAGAAGGATIGAAFGGIGAAPGAAIGGALGGIAGFFGGDKVGGMIGDFMSKFDFAPIKEKAANTFNGLKEQAGAMFEGAKERAAKALDFSATIDVAKDKFASMKESIAQTFTAENIGFAIGYALERLSMLPDEAEQYLTQLEQDIETSISNAITGAGVWFDQLVSDAGNYFNQLVTDAGTWLSGLPDAVSTWYEQTKASAVQRLGEMADETSKWFSELPGRAEQGLSNLLSTVSNWCSNIVSDVRNWFSQIPGIIANAFDSAASAVRSKWEALKESASNFSFGFGAGQAAAHRGFANGGFVNRAETVNVAEGNRLEAIIPLDPAMRARGVSLWQQAGALLGMNTADVGGEQVTQSLTQQFAQATTKDTTANVGSGVFQQVAQMLQNGGGQVIPTMSSFQPAMAGAAGFSAGGSSDNGGGSNSNSFNFSGMSVSFGNNMSEEDMAVAIGKRIFAEIKQSFENRG